MLSILSSSANLFFALKKKKNTQFLEEEKKSKLKVIVTHGTIFYFLRNWYSIGEFTL